MSHDGRHPKASSGRFASTYSYPCALRIEDAASAAGVALSGARSCSERFFVAQGWNDSQFHVYPVKGQ